MIRFKQFMIESTEEWQNIDHIHKLAKEHNVELKTRTYIGNGFQGIYIDYIGRNSGAKKGSGGKIIDAIVAHVKKHGKEAYLNTTNPKLQNFYHRHGFESMIKRPYNMFSNTKPEKYNNIP